MSDKTTNPNMEDNLIIVNDKVKANLEALTQDELRDKYNQAILRESREGLTNELNFHKNILSKLIMFNLLEPLVA